MKHNHFWIFSLCLALILGGTCVPAGARERVTEISLTIGSGQVTIDGSPIQTEPSYTENGATLVPLRVISEAFGAQVEWSEKTRSVSIYLGDCTILLMIDDKSCYVNGTEKILIAAPALKNSTTMVPLRFISETFGAQVQYDEKTNGVLVRYTHTLTGTKLQMERFGASIIMPEGWTQKTTGADRLLMEKYYSGGTVDFVYVMAAETGVSGEEWLRQETDFLKSGYDTKNFRSEGGTDTDENGDWTTLEVTVTYPLWKTLLKERYMAGADMGYFVRYGRLEPSPQDGDSGDEEGADEISAPARPQGNLGLPGSAPAWDEMERILDTLEITPQTAAAVKAKDPHWNASQHLLNKYDGWQMDLPESFQTVKGQTGHSIYEQQPDGIRLVMACAPEKVLTKFENIVPFRIPLVRDKNNYYYKNYQEAFATRTMDDLKKSGNYVHSESVELSKEQQKEIIGNSTYKLVALNIQKDTVRYHTWNYFFVVAAANNPVYFLAQILMPEQTSNWLDMNRVYQSLHTFRYSR